MIYALGHRRTEFGARTTLIDEGPRMQSLSIRQVLSPSLAPKREVQPRGESSTRGAPRSSDRRVRCVPCGLRQHLA
jgi:hypothetical protein